MWHDVVSEANRMAGRATLGFVDTLSAYPVTAGAVLAILGALSLALMVLEIRAGLARAPDEIQRRS